LIDSTYRIFDDGNDPVSAEVKVERPGINYPFIRRSA